MMPRCLGRLIVAIACLLSIVGISSVPGVAQTASPAKPFVAELALDGPIGPASAEYFHAASERARHDGARAIVLRLDTPGGLSESMRRIIADILASPVPVLCYVGPQGARAASAGTYIFYACAVAAMAPATHLGAATPVALGGSTPMPTPQPPLALPATSPKPAAGAHGDAEAHKVTHDAIAYLRSLAQLHGRNADWAEKAVREAATLTAREAVEKHVADFLAASPDQLLQKASGRTATVDGKNVTIALGGLPIRHYTPDWRAQFLGIITNPTIAYILLMAGIWGIVLEVFHPGVLWPGISGVICLLVGLYALQMLPINYVGLALMALGVGLLVAEVLVPTYGALGIGGVIAFVTGSIMLLDTDVPGYGINLGVIGGIALSGIALLGFVLWVVLRARRAHVVSGNQQMLDASGELLQAVQAGGKAWALVQGEKWRVCSDADLPKGASVRVVRRQGLTLWVAPHSSQHD